MALTWDQLSAVTQKKFIPKIVDNIFDSDILLSRAKKKGWYKSVSGGERVVTPLGYAQSTSGGWYSGSDTMSVTDSDTISAAEWTWKQAYETINISGADEMKNAGDSQIVDFVKAKTQIAEKTLIDRLQTGMYNDGTTAKAIQGLRHMLSTSNTVGGISQTSYTWWAAQVDASNTTLTLPVLQTTYNNCSINNESPTVIVGTRANYNRFYALLQPQQRFMDSDTAKAGFTSLMFNGTPFVIGSKASGIMMLNEEYLILGYHPQRDFKFEPFQKPINQDVRSAKLLWMGIFGCTNIRMQGYLSAIAA